MPTAGNGRTAGRQASVSDPRGRAVQETPRPVQIRTHHRRTPRHRRPRPLGTEPPRLPSFVHRWRRLVVGPHGRAAPGKSSMDEQSFDEAVVGARGETTTLCRDEAVSRWALRRAEPGPDGQAGGRRRRGGRRFRHGGRRRVPADLHHDQAVVVARGRGVTIRPGRDSHRRPGPPSGSGGWAPSRTASGSAHSRMACRGRTAGL